MNRRPISTDFFILSIFPYGTDIYRCYYLPSRLLSSCILSRIYFSTFSIRDTWTKKTRVKRCRLHNLIPKIVLIRDTWNKRQGVSYVVFTNFYQKYVFTSFEYFNIFCMTVRASKTGIDFMNFSLLFVENCLQLDAIHDFSVWLRTVVLIQRIVIGFLKPYWKRFFTFLIYPIEQDNLLMLGS